MKYAIAKWLLLSIGTIVISEIFKKSIPIYELIYNSLSQKFTVEQINEIFDIQKRWQWATYIFLSILLLLKTSIIAVILYVGLFLSSRDLKFKQIWNIVLNAEFIFLLVPIFKIIWFSFFQPNYTLLDIQNFFPLSALNLVDYKSLETWFIYPFQILNVFEFIYILYLSSQIGKLTKTNTDYGLKIVCSSYVPVLFLWVVIVMFFTLNYS